LNNHVEVNVTKDFEEYFNTYSSNLIIVHITIDLSIEFFTNTFYNDYIVIFKVICIEYDYKLFLN